MNNANKIEESHRRRKAYVYIRQSTLKQVEEHQESQELQYQLVERAKGFGWREEQIEVIDEDLGKSAISSQERNGFQRLLIDVALGAVGLILVTDVSRLARNCADWYHLLDLASVSQVLVSDSGGVYNPCLYDDRLLLGVKGAFSEAQWYTMRQQMQAARLNKAKRGELALRLPIGYERLADGRVVLSADQQVQGALRLVFRLFRQLGSARAVLRHLRTEGIQLPHQAANGLGVWDVAWRAPSYSAIYQLLTLPAYSGAYTYGKQQRQQLPGGGKGKSRQHAQAEWLVLLPNVYPAYLSWEDYQQNQQTLAGNWQATRFAAKQVAEAANSPLRQARAGRALLQGLVYCGVCGRAMRLRYKDKPAYVCEANKAAFDLPRCLCLPFAHVDAAVVATFLDSLQPAMLEAALLAVAQVEEQRNALRLQWQHQLERARYEADRARLRYEKVDPTLRLVAAELEQRWEESLRQLERLQNEWQTVQAQAIHPPSPSDAEAIRQLASDLPALWLAGSTSNSDRKRLLRCLIQDVTLRRTQPTQAQVGLTHIAIRWQTGASTQLTVHSPKAGHPTHLALLERVRGLAQTLTDDKIAHILNLEGCASPWHSQDQPPALAGTPVTWWSRRRVHNLRNKHAIPTGSPLHAQGPGPRADGLFPALHLAQQLGLSVSVILQWFRRGLLAGHQIHPASPVWLRFSPDDRKRLDGTAFPQPDMVAFLDAPAHFAMTHAQLRAAITEGRFLPYRLALGRQFRWFLLPAQPPALLPT